MVPGNTAPPDRTISNVVKETYVNKVYISVLGRKPLDKEFANGLTILNQHNFSAENRKQLLDTVLAGEEYNSHLYSMARQDLLNNMDTAEISNNIYVLNLLLGNSDYAPYYDFLTYEIKRLEAMKAIPSDLQSGSMNVIELHRRCVDNMFYDGLNMGTENFVVSLFQHFMLSYPTEKDLEGGKKMVDGFTSIFLYHSGQNKNELMDIFFSSQAYFEGQVRILFHLYLFKEPSATDIASLSALYRSGLNFKELQKNILTRDDYAGI